MPAGRPVEYKPGYCDAVIEFKASWRWHWAVVNSADEAIEVVTRGER